ncbi:MAG: DUF3737 family protein [Lachnospiraceae bacterium]|nr:DUF3737 family protein [Lachnospiraceae bacterium]
MEELCRAALWYSTDIEITDTKLHGIKALRECSDVVIKNATFEKECLLQNVPSGLTGFWR